MTTASEMLNYEPTEIEKKLGVIFRTGTYITTYSFFQEIRLTDSWKLLDKREQDLVTNYLVDDKTFDDLKPMAGVTSRERVRQIIRSGLRRSYRYSPPEIQSKYSEDEILKLKDPSLIANRSSIIGSKKESGKRQWEERGGEMTKAIKDGLKKRRQRIANGEIQSHSRRSTPFK